MDYHESDLNEIEFAEKMRKKYKSEIHIIHVTTTSESESESENFI